ncbi:MAG: PAS domain-containing protein [Anaerolineaceae bacterium]|jgi:transcriptional regulator with PAS, ATPase and Fis domain|nr:MAG: PAS domain-containing protein [Anaerolineaceae bacterium]
MHKNSWQEEFPAAITVTDSEGKIIEMNQKAAGTFAASGGKNLIGKNILDCHPKSAQEKINQIAEQRVPNIYTIQKGGKKNLIYQAPYYQDGGYAGLVEISFELPDEIPHFNRDKK